MYYTNYKNTHYTNNTAYIFIRAISVIRGSLFSPIVESFSQTFPFTGIINNTAYCFKAIFHLKKTGRLFR